MKKEQKVVESVAKVEEIVEKPSTKKGAKTMKKTELTGYDRAVAVLQEVAKTAKGFHLSAKGTQLIHNDTHEVMCCVRKNAAAKVTMPLPRTGGIKPCEGNHHMTWIAFDHKDLKEFFLKRLASKKTMYDYEKEVYDAGISPARARAHKVGRTAEERISAAEAKIKELEALKQAAMKELKAKKEEAKSSKKTKTTKTKAKAQAKA